MPKYHYQTKVIYTSRVAELGASQIAYTGGEKCYFSLELDVLPGPDAEEGVCICLSMPRMMTPGKIVVSARVVDGFLPSGSVRAAYVSADRLHLRVEMRRDVRIRFAVSGVYPCVAPENKS